MAYSGWISIKGRPGLKWRQDLRLFCLASCLTPSHHSKRKQTPPYQRQFETLSYRAVAHLLRATVYRWLHSLQTTTQSTTVYRWLRSLHMTTVLYRNSPTVPILLLLLTLLQKFSVRAQFCSGWKTKGNARKRVAGQWKDFAIRIQWSPGGWLACVFFASPVSSLAPLRT